MSADDNAPQPVAPDWQVRLLQGIFKFILYVPWIWFAVFALFVLGVTVGQGSIPTAGQPDPKDAGAISLLYMPSLLLLLFTMATAPIGVGLALIKLLRDLPALISRREALLYLLGIALFALFVFTDAAGLMTWLGD